MTKSRFCPKGHDKDVVGRRKGRCAECCRERCRNWISQNPEKEKAHYTAGNAKRKVCREPRRIAPVWFDFSWIRSTAKKRGLDFTLDRRHCEDLMSDNCFYCGASPEPRNGIDRVDNANGYVEDNVVTSCWDCNRAKGTQSRVDFEQWIYRAAKHQAQYAEVAPCL